MEVKINTNVQPSFQAKISPRFEKFMRDFYNQGPFRKQNNYKLSKKLEKLDSYGHDDLTINLATRYTALGKEFSLVATKEGQDVNNGIYLLKETSVKKIVDAFYKMKKNGFNKLVERNKKYKP